MRSIDPRLELAMRARLEQRDLRRRTAHLLKARVVDREGLGGHLGLAARADGRES